MFLLFILLVLVTSDPQVINSKHKPDAKTGLCYFLIIK